MRLKAKKTDGNTFEVEVPDDSTVLQLRPIVAQATGVDETRMRMIYQGRVLSDGDTVSSHGLSDGHVVHVIERPLNMPSGTTGTTGASGSTGPAVPSQAQIQQFMAQAREVAARAQPGNNGSAQNGGPWSFMPLGMTVGGGPVLGAATATATTTPNPPPPPPATTAGNTAGAPHRGSHPPVRVMMTPMARDGSGPTGPPQAVEVPWEEVMAPNPQGPAAIAARRALEQASAMRNAGRTPPGTVPRTNNGPNRSTVRDNPSDVNAHMGHTLTMLQANFDAMEPVLSGLEEDPMEAVPKGSVNNVPVAPSSVAQNVTKLAAAMRSYARIQRRFAGAVERAAEMLESEQSTTDDLDRALLRGQFNTFVQGSNAMAKDFTLFGAVLNGVVIGEEPSQTQLDLRRAMTITNDLHGPGGARRAGSAAGGSTQRQAGSSVNSNSNSNAPTTTTTTTTTTTPAGNNAAPPAGGDLLDSLLDDAFGEQPQPQAAPPSTGNPTVDQLRNMMSDPNVTNAVVQRLQGMFGNDPGSGQPSMDANSLQSLIGMMSEGLQGLNANASGEAGGARTIGESAATFWPALSQRERPEVPMWSLDGLLMSIEKALTIPDMMGAVTGDWSRLQGLLLAWRHCVRTYYFTDAQGEAPESSLEWDSSDLMEDDKESLVNHWLAELSSGAKLPAHLSVLVKEGASYKEVCMGAWRFHLKVFLDSLLSCREPEEWGMKLRAIFRTALGEWAMVVGSICRHGASDLPQILNHYVSVMWNDDLLSGMSGMSTMASGMASQTVMDSYGEVETQLRARAEVLKTTVLAGATGELTGAGYDLALDELRQRLSRPQPPHSPAYASGHVPKPTPGPKPKKNKAKSNVPRGAPTELERDPEAILPTVMRKAMQQALVAAKVPRTNADGSPLVLHGASDGTLRGTSLNREFLNWLSEAVLVRLSLDGGDFDPEKFPNIAAYFFEAGADIESSSSLSEGATDFAEPEGFVDDADSED